MRVVAFGWLAERLSKFGPNEYIVLNGKLRKSAPFTSKEGKEYPGEWEVVIDHIDNWPEKESANAQGTTENNPPLQGLGGLGNNTGTGMGLPKISIGGLK